MIDPTTSLNVMRAMQAPNQPQQNKAGESGGAQQGGLPPQVQQLVNAIMQAIQGMLAKGKDGQKDGLSDTDKQQVRGAVEGVQNGRLSQERQQMT